MFVFLLPPANEVWGKVIFLHLSVILFTVGCLVPGGGGVPGPGGSAPGGCLVPGGGLLLGGAWSWVGLLRGCVPSPGGVVPGGDTPPRLLLRAVRILLECILVKGKESLTNLHKPHKITHKSTTYSCHTIVLDSNLWMRGAFFTVRNSGAGGSASGSRGVSAFRS